MKLKVSSSTDGDSYSFSDYRAILLWIDSNPTLQMSDKDMDFLADMLNRRHFTQKQKEWIRDLERRYSKR